MIGERVHGAGGGPRLRARRRGRPGSSCCSPSTRAAARTPAAGTSFEHELDPPPSERQAKLVAEARVLARRLRELVDAGEATPGEIVVLLRAFTHVDAYEEALERAGLGALRGRRARLLVPAAGRGPAAAARGGRQPARRRDAARRPRLPRQRGQPGRALAAAARDPGRGRGRRAAADPAPLAAGRVALRRLASAGPSRLDEAWLERDPGRRRDHGSSASARSSPSCAPPRRCSPSTTSSSGR